MKKIIRHKGAGFNRHVAAIEQLCDSILCCTLLEIAQDYVVVDVLTGDFKALNRRIIRIVKPK